MDTQKSLKISILGKGYSIITDENQDDVHKAVALVDKLMRGKVINVPPSAGKEKVAVIVALQLAIDLTKKQQLLEKYENDVSRVDSLLNEEL